MCNDNEKDIRFEALKEVHGTSESLLKAYNVIFYFCKGLPAHSL